MNNSPGRKTSNRAPLVSMHGISKSFPLVQANNQIDLDIFSGEIHALLGENGAGKSTLMKILYGYYQADAGTIFFNNNPVTIQSPRDAINLNIGMVFQDLVVIPAFTVTENISLFLKDTNFIFNEREIRKKILEVSKRYGFDIDPDIQASNLSIGELQKVEIIKLLMSDAKLFILDEPTRVLAPHEAEAFFKVLRKLRDAGYAILLITHKLQEVIENANRVTVLRKGKVSGTLHKSTFTKKELIQMMFAKSLGVQKTMGRNKGASKSPALQMVNVSSKSDPSQVKLQDFNLDIYPGEIVGVAGVSGNGQKELCDLILGKEKCVRGEKFLFGENATNWSISRVRDSGVAFVPENPLKMSIAGWLPVLINMVITRMQDYSLWGGFRINWKKVNQDSRKAFSKLGFEVPQLQTSAMSLSGGNLQRMTIARELFSDPKLIIASYLTRGLDVQSTLAAHQALRDARNRRSGILFISEDLDELFSLSDRLIVLFDGKIVGNFRPEDTNIFEIGLLMTGTKENE